MTTGTLTLRLPADLEKRLAAEAERSRQNRSQLAREALSEFLRRREQERFMDEIVRAARALAADPEAVREARELAEEFLPADDEALEVAEGPRAQEAGGSEDRWWR